MLSLIFSTSQCLLNMTFGMACTTKGIYCFNPTTINVVIPSLSTPTHSPDWYCADFHKSFHLSSKYSHKKRSLFHEVLLTHLTCQHHLVEFYLAMTNMASEIFQKITCTIGVMYNVNVRHYGSMMHMVVSLAVYKSLFD